MDYMKMIELGGMPATMMQNNQAGQAQQTMNYGNQLAQQALTANGFTPQQMASALRQTNQPTETQLNPNQAFQVLRLGSNPWSSTSDYSTGVNGWGNYGE